jgi:hypothetical protein
MALNFRVHSHRRNNDLHLKLRGDFDGSSAYELINILKNSDKINKVFIHTTYLDTIYPFGLKVFRNNLGKPVKQIIFTGKNSCKISP